MSILSDLQGESTRQNLLKSLSNIPCFLEGLATNAFHNETETQLIHAACLSSKHGKC